MSQKQDIQDLFDMAKAAAIHEADRAYAEIEIHKAFLDAYRAGATVEQIRTAYDDAEKKVPSQS